MLTRRRAKPSLQVLALIAALAALAGCGSGLKTSPSAKASETATTGSGECTQTVMSTLLSVLGRVYHEGVSSERTLSAEHLIDGSASLRQAIEADSPSAARAAAQALLKTGHMTDLRVTVGGHVLASVGGAALAPLQGTIKSPGGGTLATYLFSVWADKGFYEESDGIAEGLVALRLGGRSIAGSAYMAPGTLPAEGTTTRKGVAYAYASLQGQAYPSGSALGVYLLKPLSAIQKLCGSSNDDTVVNTLGRVAHLIYEAEAGPRTLVQIHRVQANAPLLRAVAEENPTATRVAVEALLHQHLVRLRVIGARGRLLEDDGGPYVLAPVHASLRLHGRTIGHIVLSIQDDEGYEKLAHRLAGLPVLMYMTLPGQSKPSLVKNSLGPGVGGLSSVPAAGTFAYHGREFRVLTVQATAFPSGPLTIRVLIPIPYS
jgi:predicted small lipoprotein YifL